MASSLRSSSAAPQGAAHILQLDRALYLLSKVDADVSIAVEYFDDVSALRDGIPILHEQDKNSVRPGVDVLGNRSKALWRTFEIWLDLLPRLEGQLCDRYLLVTNTVAKGTIVMALKAVSLGTKSPSDVVLLMRSAAQLRSKSVSKVQALIDAVLAHDDERLEQLIARIEIVEAFEIETARKEMINGFAIHPRVDATLVLDKLLGWVTGVLRNLWGSQQPGVISRQACVLQCRSIEEQVARQRFLPKPAGDVIVTEADRDRALARPFVEHLSRIDLEQDWVLEAVEHFVQFNIEKHRLAAEGEIPIEEWFNRGERLGQRWRNIVRRTKMALPTGSRTDVGRQILVQATFDYHETLAGQDCHELYMTAGHYHRLADDDKVWWDPHFKLSGDRT